MSGDAPRFDHRSILASAGSGKTYRLTSRFLELVDAGENPGRILSSTFTRLAAGEIRDRILHRLAHAVLDVDGRKQLAASIGRADLSHDRAATLLEAVAGNVQDLQIRTIDSFFAGVVQAFSWQLGLAADATLADEHLDDWFRREAIRHMLDHADPEPLVEILRVLTEGAGRSVTSEIDRNVKDLAEVSRESGREAWTWMGRRPLLSRDELADAIARLGAAKPTTGKSAVTAHEKDCAKLRECGHDDVDDWVSILSAGLAKPIACEETTPPTYYSRDIEPAVLAAYEPIIRHGRAVLWNHISWRTESTRDLLERYELAYEHVKTERRAFTFDDLTSLMIRSQKLGTFDEICFRLDARLHHLLLDEFQDTSTSQWRALAPIASEITADGTGERTFFCVGDVKQSIYGWRDAAPEILASLPELLSASIEVERLAASRRSAPSVIDTVNAVFDGIGTNAALDKHAAAAGFWSSIFQTHTTVHTDLDGYAELRAVPKPASDEKARDVRVREAAKLAAELYEADPHRSIAVLARTNENVGRVLFELGPTRLDVPATGRGGGEMSDAAAVNAVLDLLRLADHPDHTAAAFNVARGPLGPMVGLRPDAGRAARREIARGVRRSLVERGYAPTVHEWSVAVAERCDPRELRRLHQLVELADLHDSDPGLRPTAFVDAVLARRVDDPQCVGVQVMNIHQSKGLEFDVVIAPDLESSFGRGGGPPVALERNGPAGDITRVARWVNSQLRDPLPELAGLFDQQTARLVSEELCVLYVAMTRARRGLFMLIETPRDKVAASPAGVLRAAMVPPGEENAVPLFSRGDRSALDRVATPVPSAAPDERLVPAIRLAEPSGAPRTLVRPSGESTPTIESALRLSDDTATDVGTALHRMFEQVGWIEDGLPERPRLEEIARRAAPHRGEGWAAEQADAFLAMLRRPAIRELLTRGDADPEQRLVWREHPYARAVGGAVERGVIDRMTAERPMGVVRAAEVIDFKSDRIDAAEAVDRAERYRLQVTSYREAAAAWLDCDPGLVRQIVLFVVPGVAVDLDETAVGTAGAAVCDPAPL